MLQIIVDGREMWNEESNEFEISKTTTLNLEHSLVSISKWEMKWQKPFFSRMNRTDEETRDYIRCMTINHDVDPLVYKALSAKNIDAVSAYINNPMSAIHHRPGQGTTRESITSEKIYSWMFAYNIPMECERWHLARLMNVIDLLNDSNAPKRKRSQHDVVRSFAAENARRKAMLKSKG